MAGFIDNKYYIYKASLKKMYGPYDSRYLANTDVDEGDTLLLALQSKPVKACKEAAVDFDNNTLTIIKGTFKDYTTGTYEVEAETLFKYFTELQSSCDNLQVLGVPPLEGECLDALLYL